MPNVSKMKDSVLNKKQGEYTQFSPKKDSWKMKLELIWPIIFAATPADGSCYRVIDSSILQEFVFFICPKMFIMQWRKNIKSR